MEVRTNSGIIFDLPGDELRKHCAAREKYHREKTAFYLKKEMEFSKVVEHMEVEPETTKYSNSTTLNNRERMMNSKNHHADRAAYFKFCCEHFRQDEYRLTNEDVIRLEFVANR